MKRQLIALSMVIVMVTTICTVAATTAAGATPTTFSIATSTKTPKVNQQFTISGTLKTSTGTALTSKPVHLESHKKNSDGTWTAWGNLADTYKRTDSAGKVSSTRALTTPGVREYRWHYNGTTTYAAVRSAAVTVTVKLGTTLTLLRGANIGQYHYFYGKLTDQKNVPLAKGTQVTLKYRDTSTNMQWKYYTTMTLPGSDGTYSFSYIPSQGETTYFQTSYAGDSTHLPSTSPVISTDSPIS